MYNICTQNIPLVVTLRWCRANVQHLYTEHTTSSNIKRGVELMYNICTQNIPLVVTLAWCRANVQHLYTEHTTSSNIKVV